MPIFMKLTRGRQRFAQDVGTQFHGKPTYGFVADIWSENGRSPGYSLSVKLTKQFLKQEMGLRNRVDILYSVAHYYALWPRCLTHARTHARSLTRMHGSRQSVDPRDSTRDPAGVFTERLLRKIQSCRPPEYSTLRFLPQVVECLTCELLKWAWRHCHFRSSGTTAKNPQSSIFRRAKQLYIAVSRVANISTRNVHAEFVVVVVVFMC